MVKFSDRKFLIVVLLMLMVSILLSSPIEKSKNYAADPLIEDLRLRIEILYYDKDLVQHEDTAISPTTVTTGTTTRFRAMGGTSNYVWRLIPADDSDATISGTTNADLTYTAGAVASRTFDVLVLSDGIEEVSLNVVVVKARLKTDGSGSKGSGCFLKNIERD